jgi:hypothetical protein
MTFNRRSHEREFPKERGREAAVEEGEGELFWQSRCCWKPPRLMSASLEAVGRKNQRMGEPARPDSTHSQA